MLASSKHKYSKILAFSDTYYELIINLLQSVELFCAYVSVKFLKYHNTARNINYMISSTEIIAIGKRIKSIRNARNITQEKLAELSDLTLAHISNIENGHSKMSIDSLIAISNALSVSTDAILFGEITYDKEPYYKEFVNIMLDCTDNEKKHIMQTTLYTKQLIHDIKSEAE